ncbi:DNA repair endonuclease XPF [Galendromus occidentalis]|uniref:DNA repair endonuclease XPF n=1 Tax=Galendromus occidentalis TaxID=34638 RepID=A0AAJ7SEF4_9ACAR|nr:DNA repair endonuclease XPF [Galendromus occidentalis]
MTEAKSAENRKLLDALLEKTPLLKYQQEALTDIVDRDALLITARGLGLHSIFHALIRVYHAPENLVIILGTEPDQEVYIKARLEKGGMKNMPKWITSDAFDTNARTKLYKEGGVLFVTSRILIGDLLNERIPIEHVTGFIVNNAETVQNSQQDLFILRLYRDKNRTGFVKALSSKAPAFTQEFMQLTRVMSRLYVRHLILYPRFHESVKESLNESLEVYETYVPLTQSMEQIQFALMDLIEISIRDIKKLNQTLNIDEFTTANVMGKSFYATMKTCIDPQWHLLSGKTRRSIGDLKNLKKLMEARLSLSGIAKSSSLHSGLTKYDPVTFFHSVKSVWHAKQGCHQTADWTLMDSGESLYLAAEKRVFAKVEGTKKDREKEFKPEVPPKWISLIEVLKNCDSKGNIVIVVEEERTRRQLEEFLCVGSYRVLRSAFQKLLADAEENVVFPRDEKDNKSDSSVESDSSKPSYTIVSVTTSNPFEFEELLLQQRPLSVVLFDLHLSTVRTLEIYHNLSTQSGVTVYTITYAKSVDEQRYYTSVRKEKEAFANLIQEKAAMASKTDWDEEINVARGENRVIVDVREFRSDLPALVYRRGIDLCPGTLEVGDYILTPTICVERKALQDLIDSLCSGRLYRQSERMSLHYEVPVVLIEFSSLEAFSFKNKLQSEIISKKTVQRLIMLTLTFPKLRLLWSPSPHATAELFELLKKDRPQPTLVEALKVTESEIKRDDGLLERFNTRTTRFLETLPGVGAHCKYKIMRRFSNLKELLTASEDVLLDVLESRDNTTLFMQTVQLPFEKRGKKRPLE